MIEETPNGPQVINVHTTAELEAMDARATRKQGICPDLAALPPSAHLDMRALAKILHRSTKSIQRAIRRGDLPKPFRFMGKCVWLAGTIIEHLQSMQQAALQQAARRAKQLERHVA